MDYFEEYKHPFDFQEAVMHFLQFEEKVICHRSYQFWKYLFKNYLNAGTENAFIYHKL